MSIKFAAIGINHFHIYGQVKLLLREGAEIVAFHAIEDDLAAPFAAEFPTARRVADQREILDDPRVALVLTSGINATRAPLGIEVMRAGKDFMSDKPGITSLEQLEAVREAQAATGRIYSICYSEHFEVRCAVKAGELVHGGAIGRLVNIVGLGPHRLNRKRRPAWFFDRAQYGGILTDIASHQVEQFLFFTGADDAVIASACVANRDNPADPGLQDFGEMLLRAKDATGYIRVDWFTPDGMPNWGDGRMVLIGTEGTIELRKYLDLGGENGTDHLFLVDQQGVQRIDCTHVDLPYGRQLIEDVLHRTETAMPQARCFKAAEIALRAQAMAESAA